MREGPDGPGLEAAREPEVEAAREPELEVVREGPDAGWLTSRQASERLGVKLSTLYAYASRGLISSMPGTSQRGWLYAREDVDRLHARHAARSGHGPVAAGALRFGEPVLETSISDITAAGPRYRGRLATELCRAGVSFERVAELLWSGQLPDTAAEPRLRLTCDTLQVWPLLRGQAVLPKMALLLAALALSDDARHAATHSAEHERARALFHWLAQAPASRPPPPHTEGQHSVARALLNALGAPHTTAHVSLIDRALVLCAEHELNASTFAARVAASAGADLYACLGAAINTLSGSAHGGQCQRVEALLASIASGSSSSSADNAARTVNGWLARGEQLPGFGHPLYAAGDPRGALLIDLARDHGARSEPAKTALALLEVVHRAEHPAPTLDAGLVTLCHCLELPPGSAAAIFALGRSAGWVAHALEQRAARYLLRPRARYIGVSGTAD